MSKLCPEKERYESRRGALRARAKVLDKGAADYLRSYHCPHCDGWHLTSQKPRFAGVGPWELDCACGASAWEHCKRTGMFGRYRPCERNEQMATLIVLDKAGALPDEMHRRLAQSEATPALERKTARPTPR